MTASEHLGRQFAEPSGDPAAKKELRKQLKKNFPKDARAWLDRDDVTVEAPARVSADRVDWTEYPDWRASRQLKEVVRLAKGKVAKGKGRPSVMTDSPSDDKLHPIDGHHHALARLDHKEKPLTYVVHVPHADGPWRTMNDRQVHDVVKDDFGKTSKKDRND